jgi:hypothetical protein
MPESLHKGAHSGSLKGAKYNQEFAERLAKIQEHAGVITGDDVWRIRGEMLFKYFGIVE